MRTASCLVTPTESALGAATSVEMPAASSLCVAAAVGNAGRAAGVHMPGAVR